MRRVTLIRHSYAIGFVTVDILTMLGKYFSYFPSPSQLRSVLYSKIIQACIDYMVRLNREEVGGRRVKSMSDIILSFISAIESLFLVWFRIYICSAAVLGTSHNCHQQLPVLFFKEKDRAQHQKKKKMKKKMIKTSAVYESILVSIPAWTLE